MSRWVTFQQCELRRRTRASDLGSPAGVEAPSRSFGARRLVWNLGLFSRGHQPCNNLQTWRQRALRLSVWNDQALVCLKCACLFEMTKPGEGPFNYTSLHSRISVLWIITFHETFKWFWVVLSMKKSVITVYLCSVLYLLSFMGATYAQPCHFDWKLQTDDIDRNNWWVAFILRFTKCLVASEDGALGLETTPKLLSATCTYIGRTWHLGKTFRK